MQMQIDDNLRSGMTHDQARRHAVLKLGGMERAKEAYRDAGTVPLLESLVQDTRFAIRQLRKNPGFTSVAILMIALGLAASAALFAFVDAALIRPLPYPDPMRLVHVTESTDATPVANLSYLDYTDWRRMNRVFSSLDVYAGTGYLMNSPAGTEPVKATQVSSGFFSTLGVTLALGRGFYVGEDSPGGPNSVILSYACWQNRFGGAKDVVGRTIRLSGVAHTVAGVLPRTFQFARRGNAELWTLVHGSSDCELNRSCHSLKAIARLKEGVSTQAALAEMKSVAKRLEQQYPGSNRGQGASVLPLSEVIVGDVRPILLVLLSGGLLLLFTASLNVANLLLSRSQVRLREMALRRSLGASTARLTRQFVTEASVLTGAASMLGLILAGSVMKVFSGLVPPAMMQGMPYLEGLGLNTHVLGFAGLAAILAGTLFSLVPSVHLHFANIPSGLAEGGRGSAGRAWRNLGSRLVVLELAVAMVLLVGAGLLGKSLTRLLHVDLGFQPDHLATLGVAAADSKYGKEEQAAELGRAIVNRIRAQPGVRSVGLTNMLPVSFNGNTDWIRVVGRPYRGEHNEVNQRDVSTDYFRVLQARLLRGRYFTDADDGSKPRVAIINQTFATKYFPGEDPLGKRFGDNGLSAKSIREVVGIVGDIREGSLGSEIWPAEYLPFSQNPDTYLSVVVRTSEAEQSMLAAATAAVHQVDPELGVLDLATMNERINDSPSAYIHRASAWLVGGFAGAALLLGVVGLYGVVAYSVTQRTREIGIRMALGAAPNNVHRLILREAGWLTAAGLAGGLLCSLAAATLIRKLLFGVTSWDPSTLAGVALVLGTAALLASYIPARRAASVNPIRALRAE